MNHDEQLTDNMVDFTSHAGDDHLDDDNRAKKVERVSHSGRLKATENALGCNEKQWEVTATNVLLYYFSGTVV
jgi:hypothetical protein